MFLKVKIGQILADWPTPPFLQNGPHCRAPNTWVGNIFHKTDPLLILTLCTKKLKNFQIGQFRADWQTPHFSKRPPKWGLKYMSWQFFHKTDPLCIWILYKKLLKNFQIGPFLADWQISNFIVGHKYRRGAWNLPHKFHLYLIYKTCRGAPYMLTRLPSRPWEAPQNTSPLKDPPLYNNQPPSRVHTLQWLSSLPLPAHSHQPSPCRVNTLLHHKEANTLSSKQLEKVHLKWCIFTWTFHSTYLQFMT